MLTLSSFFITIPGYNLLQSLIYYIKNIFRQNFGSPTIWEYKDKISLKYIETETGITICGINICGNTQTEFLIILY